MKKMIAKLKPSVLTKRRWETFKSNKRAYISFLLFGSFFCMTLFAEIIANDKPIFLYYKDSINQEQHFYFPIFQNITEEDLGLELPLNVNYHDAFITEIIEKNGFALWPIIHYSYDTISSRIDITFPSKPSRENWLGTDDNGRDILARIIYGVRLSVLFGLSLCFFSSVVGIVAGLMQGYYGGKVDLLFQRFMEIWSGMPVLYLIIIISSAVVINFWLLLGIMLLFSWMSLVSVVRMESLKTRNMDYIRAAHALGISDWKIMYKHILPNAIVALIASLPFVINTSIVSLTSLDFLGFGLPPSYPSLGELVAQGKNNLYAPWIGLAGFFTLGGMLTALVLIGEGVRDAFDPRVFLYYENNNLPLEQNNLAKEVE